MIFTSTTGPSCFALYSTQNLKDSHKKSGQYPDANFSIVNPTDSEALLISTQHQIAYETMNSNIASGIKIILKLVTPLDRDAFIWNNAMRTDRTRRRTCKTEKESKEINYGAIWLKRENQI